MNSCSDLADVHTYAGLIFDAPLSGPGLTAADWGRACRGEPRAARNPTIHRSGQPRTSTPCSGIWGTAARVRGAPDRWGCYSPRPQANCS